MKLRRATIHDPGHSSRGSGMGVVVACVWYVGGGEGGGLLKII